MKGNTNTTIKTNGEIDLLSRRIIKKKKRFRIALIILFILFVLLVISYLLFTLIYNGYNFTISLDRDLYYDNNVIIYDNEEYKTYRQQLKAQSLEYFDNIKGTWIPDDVNKGLGSHNGKNYLAYSFYIENMGDDKVDYYDEMLIEDVVKNVDGAIRIKIYFDEEVVTYAKKNSNGKDEEGCKSFESEDMVFSQHIKDFLPGEKHKYTIVIWIEGTDEDCNDNIIGGEFKISMKFNSDFTDDEAIEKSKNKDNVKVDGTNG